MPSPKTSYLGDINRLIKDERISPNRRTILFMLKLWLKMEPGPDRDLVRGVIDKNFGSGSRIKWTDPDDQEAIKDSLTNLDKEATMHIRNIFEEALKEKDDATVQSS